MSSINEILNYSDDSSEESSTIGPSNRPSIRSSSASSVPSSIPSSLSLNDCGSVSSSSSGRTSSEGIDPGRTSSYDIKEEPAAGLADQVKQGIQRDIEQRNNTHQKQLSRMQPLNLTVPKSIINKKLLNRNLVQIAIRRKTLPASKDTGAPAITGSKLHTKSLEAGLRVKLTLAPDLVTLYNSLTPHTNRQKTLNIFQPGKDSNDTVLNNNYLNDVNLTTKALQLIDNNLVDLSVFSKKVLKAFTHTNHVSNRPTFNSLNTAVHNLFGIDHYSLVRITRSTATDHDGSVLLKFETAKPGELNLIDDDNFTDELFHSIGKEGDDPSNLFIKKIIARPRYKSDMKIYLIPTDVHESLYVDKRMLERDIINGVLSLDFPFYKTIYCAFEYDEIMESIEQLVEYSKKYNQPSLTTVA